MSQLHRVLIGTPVYDSYLFPRCYEPNLRVGVAGEKARSVSARRSPTNLSIAPTRSSKMLKSVHIGIAAAALVASAPFVVSSQTPPVQNPPIASNPALREASKVETFR